MDAKTISGYEKQIKELNAKIAELEKDNAKLTDTVGWMHKLIWELYKRLGISIR